MRILGLDLSINSPGFTINAGNDFFFYNIQTTKKWVFSNDSWDIISFPSDWCSLNQYKRIIVIRDFVSMIIERHNVAKIHFEGYAFGASSSAVTGLAELGGVIRTMVFERGLDMDIIPPSSVKKFATGKGNAKKEQMVAAFKSQILVPDAISNCPSLNDIADSFFISKFRV